MKMKTGLTKYVTPTTMYILPLYNNQLRFTDCLLDYTITDYSMQHPSKKECVKKIGFFIFLTAFPV